MDKKHEQAGDLERRLVQEIRGIIAVSDLTDSRVYAQARKMVRNSLPDAEMMRMQVRRIRNRLTDISARCTQMLHDGKYAGREYETADRLAAIINRYRVEIDVINEAIEGC